MTRVDFYLLSEQTEQARWLFACRLCAKAYQKKHKIYIHMGSDTAAKELDRLLWGFAEESFVPHACTSSSSAQAKDPKKNHGNVLSLRMDPLHPCRGDESLNSPILIGNTIQNTGFDLLINLNMIIPESFNTYQRIIESIPNEKTQLEQARNHFRFYREHGYQLKSHSFK